MAGPGVPGYAGAVAPLDMAGLARVANRFPARLVVIFGSVARGRSFAWSDVDVGVSGCDFWTGLRLGAAIGAALGRQAHVVDLDRSGDHLRFRAAREGLLVREVDGAWARFRAEAALRWFDVAPIVVRCAEGARRRLRLEAARG